MKKESHLNLHTLTPDEFKDLCMILFEKLGNYEQLRKARVGSNEDFEAVGIKTTENGRRTTEDALVIKHRAKVDPDEFERILHTLRDGDRFNGVVVMTSAHIDQRVVQKIISSIPRTIILSQRELADMIKRNSSIVSKYGNLVRGRTKKRRAALLLSTTLILFSAASFGSSFMSISIGTGNGPLSEKIQLVEEALQDITDLELYLEKLKKDMSRTQEEVQAIEEEYKNYQRLKDLTDEGFEDIKALLEKRSLWSLSLNYALGFILGIASSVVAGIAIEKVKANRLLTQPWEE